MIHVYLTPAPEALVIIILLGGLIVGMLMGALGGGGAILAIPLLVYGLGMAPQEATVISLIVVGLGAAAGAVTHARAGSVRLGQGLLFGALGVLGSFAGSRLSPRVDSAALMGLFAGLLVGVVGAASTAGFTFGFGAGGASGLGGGGRCMRRMMRLPAAPVMIMRMNLGIRTVQS